MNNHEKKWLLCPLCKSKTRIMLHDDTKIQNLPLFCPKCKQEVLIHIMNGKTIINKEPVIET